MCPHDGSILSITFKHGTQNWLEENGVSLPQRLHTFVKEEYPYYYFSRGCVDVCQCAKVDQFLPVRSHFESKHSEKKFRIAKFPYAAFGPLFAFHCPLFFTRNNDLE